MKFYSIGHEFDPKIIGKVEIQINEMVSDNYMEGDDSIYNVSDNSFPTITPRLDGFKLASKAKLTDILGCIFITQGLFVSLRVKKILEEFKLPEHRFYPIVIHKGKEQVTEYFWFFYVFQIENYIDFKESSFYETTVSLRSQLKMPITIGDIEEYWYQSQVIKNKPVNRILREPRHKLQEEHLVLSKKEVSYDIFSTGVFGAHQIASEALIKALTANKVSGLKITEKYLPEISLK